MLEIKTVAICPKQMFGGLLKDTYWNKNQGESQK